MPNSLANSSPSRKAQNSAMQLLVHPRGLAKPVSHSPSLPLITPPPPAIAGFPNTEPSVLSLVHPSCGFNQATRITAFYLSALALKPIA